MSRAALAALAVLAACRLGGAPPRYDYVVLAPDRRAPAPAAVTAAEDATTPIVVIGRVTLPDYLLRDEVATRAGTYGVAYAAHARWAEPLDDAFERTLRHDLAARLEPAFSVQVRRFSTPPAYTLFVDVIRFEQVGAGEVELWARWTVFHGGALLHAGDTRARRRIDRAGESADVGAMAAALSQTIARLADEVAAAVRRLDAVGAGVDDEPRT